MKKSDVGLEIIQVKNGFLIKDNEGELTVVEEEADDELSVAEKMLWGVVNFFNLGGDKYDMERIFVVRKIGENYVPQKGDKIITESYRQLAKKRF